MKARTGESFEKRRWESNPLEIALQATAYPTSPSVIVESRIVGSNSRDTEISPPGVEPGLQRSQRCVPPPHPEDMRTHQYPDLDLNQDQDFRKVSCDPLHHRDNSQELAVGFAPTSTALRVRCLSVSSHTSIFFRFKFQVPGSKLEIAAFFDLELGTWNLERIKSGTARIRTLSESFGGSLLSQEHIPVSVSGGN